MKKLLGLFLFLGMIGSFAMAMNFYGVQSLNGLGTTAIFTAPASGTYFIQGNLSLPQPYTNGNTGYSQVVSLISKNGVAFYTGSAGANGFTAYQMVLATNDAITVNLSSSAAIDKGNNAVSGQVSYGNAF